MLYGFGIGIVIGNKMMPVKPRNSFIGTHPDITKVILNNGINRVMGQTMGGSPGMMNKLFDCGEPVESQKGLYATREQQNFP